jgi:hypothetical protein
LLVFTHFLYLYKNSQYPTWARLDIGPLKDSDMSLEMAKISVWYAWVLRESGRYWYCYLKLKLKFFSWAARNAFKFAIKLKVCEFRIFFFICCRVHTVFFIQKMHNVPLLSRLPILLQDQNTSCFVFIWPWVSSLLNLFFSVPNWILGVLCGTGIQ